jgi:hypothetical protein
VHPQVRYVTTHCRRQLLLHLGRERRTPLRSGLNPSGKIGRRARSPAVSPAVHHLRWGRGAALAGTLALDHALDELVALRPLQVEEQPATGGPVRTRKERVEAWCIRPQP